MTMDRGYNGKRLYEGDLRDHNERQKRRNQGNFSNRDLGGGSFMPHDLPLSMGPITIPDDAVFRILCPSQRIGSVIGKGGNIIKNLREESGAKIKIADAILGVDERVIIISSPNLGGDRGIGKGGNNRDPWPNQDAQLSDRNGGKERNKKEKNSPRKDVKNLTPTQEALFKVHARIIADIESTRGGGSDHDEKSNHQIVTRLLVPNSQIGCLLGKGGKIIEQMRESSGAQIRVLPKDQLPGCALPIDELVQITGDVVVLKKALISISSRLQENPPRHGPQSFTPFGQAFVPMNDYMQKDTFYSKGNGPLCDLGLGHLEVSAWNFSGGKLPFDLPNSRRNKEGRDSKKKKLVFRLLCSSDMIGSVIGKGGIIIDNLRKETGARIKISDIVPGSDERIIIVSANELPGDSFSPTLEAMIQVQRRTISEMDSDKDGVVTTRLLVPTNQIGCLLGKGGNIIADMRKLTGADIRILPKDTLPRCAQETDELVQEMQIVGNPNVTRDALFQVISKLRNNTFKGSGSEVGRSNGGVRNGSRDVGLSLPPLNMPRENYNNSYDFGGRIEPNSPGNGVFALPGMNLAGGIHSSPRLGSLSSSSDVWSLGGGGGGLYNLSSFSSAPSHMTQPLAGVFSGRGNKTGGTYGSLNSMSTIEVHIPNTTIGSVIGKGGNNIAHIRQISGAKVKLHNSEQGAKDRVLELSGTQEQTHSAQSMVQAYMQSSIGGNGILSSSRFVV